MTRFEVEEVAGKPSKIAMIKIEGQQKEAWSYPVPNLLASTVPEVVFDKTGKATDIYVDDAVQFHSKRRVQEQEGR